jgi:hypothetical protein
VTRPTYRPKVPIIWPTERHGKQSGPAVFWRNGPGTMCSHGASWQNLCWFHRFINSDGVYIEIIKTPNTLRHQIQHSRLYSYWICTKIQVNSLTKLALLMDPDELWPMWPWKVGQIKNPGILSCCTHDKNLELIQIRPKFAPWRHLT